MTEGLFIVFEGGDGAGKSTQASWLAGRLREDTGRKVVETREPGGTALGEEIRELLLHGTDMASQSEALLYAAARAQHVAERIEPALHEGAIVVCDRFVDSSIAYQVVGRELSQEDVVSINRFATRGLIPDLVILLDVAADLGAQRVALGRDQEPDRLESAGTEFHRRVNGHYRELARAGGDRYATIDASKAPEQVHELVWDAVQGPLRNSKIEGEIS